MSSQLVAACSFHLHLIQEFEPGPTIELYLALLLMDIKKTLQGQDL